MQIIETISNDDDRSDMSIVESNESTNRKRKQERKYLPRHSSKSISDRTFVSYNPYDHHFASFDASMSFFSLASYQYYFAHSCDFETRRERERHTHTHIVYALNIH
jgi:hypothetical protein